LAIGVARVEVVAGELGEEAPEAGRLERGFRVVHEMVEFFELSRIVGKVHGNLLYAYDANRVFGLVSTVTVA